MRFSFWFCTVGSLSRLPKEGALHKFFGSNFLYLFYEKYYTPFLFETVVVTLKLSFQMFMFLNYFVQPELLTLINNYKI